MLSEPIFDMQQVIVINIWGWTGNVFNKCVPCVARQNCGITRVMGKELYLGIMGNTTVVKSVSQIVAIARGKSHFLFKYFQILSQLLVNTS